MTRLLQEALVVLRGLPPEEQDRAALALLAFTRELNEYPLDADQPVAAQ